MDTSTELNYFYTAPYTPFSNTLVIQLKLKCFQLKYVLQYWQLKIEQWVGWHVALYGYVLVGHAARHDTNAGWAEFRILGTRALKA